MLLIISIANQNGIKNIKGSHIKIPIVKKINVNKSFKFFLLDGINVYVINIMKIKTSFLANTSISATGYNKNIGENIASKKILFNLIFFIK